MSTMTTEPVQNSSACIAGVSASAATRQRLSAPDSSTAQANLLATPLVASSGLRHQVSGISSAHERNYSSMATHWKTTVGTRVRGAVGRTNGSPRGVHALATVSLSPWLQASGLRMKETTEAWRLTQARPWLRNGVNAAVNRCSNSPMCCRRPSTYKPMPPPEGRSPPSGPRCGADVMHTSMMISRCSHLVKHLQHAASNIVRLYKACDELLAAGRICCMAQRPLLATTQDHAAILEKLLRLGASALEGGLDRLVQGAETCAV